MYHSDFSKYRENEKGNYYYIGWLGPTHKYNTGHLESQFLSKLFAIFRREQVRLVRGINTCHLCPHQDDGRVYFSMDGFEKLLGISEIWIPNESFDKVFAAPSLILHYIDTHNYRPPQEFVDAVNAFDLNSDWSGQNAYKACMKDLYG